MLLQDISGNGQLKQVDGMPRNQDQVRSAKGGRKFGGDSARRADTGKIIWKVSIKFNLFQP